MEGMRRGKPASLLIRFMLPLMLGRVVQIVYNYADMLIVGRALGINAFAGVGSTLNAVHLIFGFCAGLADAAGILIAQRCGAGDKPGMRRTFSCGLTACFGAGTLLAILAALFSGGLLRLLNTPGEIYNYAYTYLMILLCCAPITALNQVLPASLRAVGNSRLPVRYQLVSTLFNIVLDVVLIYGARLGVAGAAAATVGAQLLTALLCLGTILKKYPDLRFPLWELPPKAGSLKELFALGLPMGLQSSIMETGNLFVQTAINSLGTSAIAAVTAAQRIRAVNMMPLFSLGTSVSVYTAQNYGAGDTNRVKQGVRSGLAIAAAAAVFMALLNFLLGRQAAALLLPDSPEAVRMAYRYLTAVGCALLLLGGMLVLRNALQGMGKKWAPTASAAAELTASLLGTFALIPLWGFGGVILISPISWLLAAVPLLISFCRWNF